MVRRPLAVVVLALLALSVAGCSSQPVSHHSPTPRISTSTKTVDQANAGPSSRFYVLCSDLVDVSSLGDGLVLAPSSPPTWPAGVAGEQTGMLDCTWTDPDKPVTGDTGVDPSVVVTAVPDAGAAGRKQIAAELASNPPAVAGNVGDESSVSCVAGGLLTCRMSVVQGDTWLFVGLYGTLSKVPGTEYGARSAVIGVASAALQKLGTAGSAWHAPTTSWSPARACSDLSADPGEVLGTGAGAWHVWNGSGDDDSARRYARYSPAWLTNCAWTPSSGPAAAGVILQVVGGGSWVWDRLGATGTSTPVSVQGADKASYRCADGYCHLDVVAADSWFQLGLTTTGVADESAKLVQIAASVIAEKA